MLKICGLIFSSKPELDFRNPFQFFSLFRELEASLFQFSVSNILIHRKKLFVGDLGS